MAVKIGDKYGRLTVIEKLPHGRYLCKCDCGSIKEVGSAWHLTSNNTQSCGCLQRQGPWRKKHGLVSHPLYKTWHNIRSRCANPGATHYAYYGDKGIKVCEAWSDFKKFYDWSIANGWKKGLTIDRINPDGDYDPSNCRWVDYITQNNNLGSNHLITYDGKTQSVYAWARELGINQKTFSERIRRGWSIDRAINQPVQKREKVIK